MFYDSILNIRRQLDAAGHNFETRLQVFQPWQLTQTLTACTLYEHRLIGTGHFVNKRSTLRPIQHGAGGVNLAWWIFILLFSAVNRAQVN